jgi:hypothetical protein
MGTSHDYACPLCEYHVARMASGYQAGMESHLHGIRCDECGELYSVPLAGTPSEVTARLRRELGVEAVRELWGETLLAAMARVALARAPLRCPAAAEHDVQPWTAPGPCPRCGETLEPDGTVLEWD